MEIVQRLLNYILKRFRTGVVIINRVVILGSPGSGKSTLAKKLGKSARIAVVHMDKLFWKPGWLQSTREELLAKQEIHLKKSSWIIEGNYSLVWDERLKKADTIIFLDLNRFLCIYRILKRWVLNRGRVRDDLAPGCPDRMTIEFLHYVWKFPYKKRDQMIKAVLIQQDHAQTIIINNKKAVKQFIDHLEFSPILSSYSELTFKKYQ
ncbi:hypothetical protein [Halobacillus sp. A5]|uniref:hypothetical protein n=1 Tax=Halobacillus sp. A5 TaxID=2880263 RepID=UPI0020A67267|nr:hypothetical protein [Halobacillus sp. A5]MCP3025939.1 hypothetical protein [Halobacillus sp. A5]